jgi:predicted ATPase
LIAQDKEKWEFLKKQLEVFGRAAGLFDEISIRRLGKRAGEPFQVQVRKFGRRLKGPPRNLIDVGYGVSQVLPVVTELLREDAQLMFLLQQPEVHLHPSAQAALGSLFCQIASPSRQLVIETHSDHLMDRVRMDVRDGVTDLKPSDVSILFFERQDLDVRIYSLRIDEEGNILDAPDGYRSFFMEEITRSMWKNHGQRKD